ncbi:NAD-dependent protein deacylase SRT2-like [Rutidosis leptorrhynchoides]|uniref:NAD-dependent protein deacylase SRT2-like n=1 Tax=Rutidosis leptorrhynchoides TaxID=125765 RepID=UPI003A999FF9
MAMATRNWSRSLFSSLNNANEVVHSAIKTTIPFQGSVRYVRTLVPNSKPPTQKDVNLLSEFFDRSKNLVVLTGAGISTECGIPDYRSPGGAYNTGYKPMIHQEFMGSSRVRSRYWAKHYESWKKFSEAKPGPAHTALATLEKANRISFMMTQNIDRLHHQAGSKPLELHGTMHDVTCVKCDLSISRKKFQDQVNSLNPTWAKAIESLATRKNSDDSLGLKKSPNGDIEIDENFWESKLQIPSCSRCNGILKPKVVFFGDNIPKHIITRSIKAAEECDAFLVLGSSLTVVHPFQLLRDAHDAGAATAIVNIGKTEADRFVDLKIDAQVGKILQRVIEEICVPATQEYDQDEICK